MLHKNTLLCAGLGAVFLFAQVPLASAAVVTSMKPLGFIAAAIADGVTETQVLLPDGASEHDVLVKRVIATAGQTVDLQDGKVVVDGQALDEDYTTGMSWPLSVQAPGAQVSYPYTVPDGCVWVMGDNRENSADSRYFGPVDRSDLIAVALVRYWPLNRIGAID